jgi:hypothetical protein
MRTGGWEEFVMKILSLTREETYGGVGRKNNHYDG